MLGKIHSILFKDQLSALLLTQVGNSADILELLKGNEEFEIFNNKEVVCITIGVFTLSIYQFALITTATMKGGSAKHVVESVEQSLGRTGQMGQAAALGGRELRANENVRKTYIDGLRIKKHSTVTPAEGRGRGRKMVVPIEVHNPKENMKIRDIHGEVFQIMVTLVMQDGPYLVLRIYLWMEFGISTEMHIFFVAKNAIVCVLLVYRLLVLSCSGEDEEETFHREDDAWRLKNVQLAQEDMYHDFDFLSSHQTEVGSIK